MTVLERIHDFLAQKRIAIAGVSREERHFSRILFREFARRGYQVTPVNPAGGEIDGVKCEAAIPAGTQAVLVTTSAAASGRVVEECAAAGVTRVWLYRATGHGAVSEPAVEFCESHAIQVIPGQCPMMFFSDAAFYHKFHGAVRKLFGTYPR